ncbi:TPA: hypothetical protein OUG05_003468 [Morganella morganii]|nr:hypothetical protein [Morganella morganii]
MSEEKGIVGKITDMISGTGSFLKSAFGTVKEIQEIQEMNVDYATKEKTYELLDKMYEAKNQQMGLQDLLLVAKNRIIELEDIINQRTNRGEEKPNYELFHPMTTTTVYRFKVTSDSNQLPHYICSECYESHMKSILQHKDLNLAFATMICHRCASEYKFPADFFKRN